MRSFGDCIWYRCGAGVRFSPAAGSIKILSISLCFTIPPMFGSIVQCRNPEKARTIFVFPMRFTSTYTLPRNLGSRPGEKFCEIYQQCLRPKTVVNSSRLRAQKDRFATYRNLIHEQVPGVRLDAHQRILIPTSDKVNTYKRWTDVLYEAKAEDFVEVGLQISNDLRALCSALEDSWKEMCKASARLVVNMDYQKRRDRGESVPITLSVTASSVSYVYSATAVNAVLCSGTDLSK